MHANVRHWHVNTHSRQHQDSHCSHHCCQLLSKSAMNNTLWIIILPSIFQCPTSAYLPSSLMITTLADLLNNVLHKLTCTNSHSIFFFPIRIMCHPCWGHVNCCPGPTHLEDAKEGKVAAVECTHSRCWLPWITCLQEWQPHFLTYKGKHHHKPQLITTNIPGYLLAWLCKANVMECGIVLVLILLLFFSISLLVFLQWKQHPINKWIYPILLSFACPSQIFNVPVCAVSRCSSWKEEVAHGLALSLLPDYPVKKMVCCEMHSVGCSSRGTIRQLRLLS